jgi:hypothetical protein
MISIIHRVLSLRQIDGMLGEEEEAQEEVRRS